MEILEGLTIEGFKDNKDNKAFDVSAFDSDRIDAIRNIIRERLVKRDTERINLLGYSSYKLKHACERDVMAQGAPLRGYVANGEFIYAMILEGFSVSRFGMNAHFNVTLESVSKFCKNK